MKNKTLEEQHKEASEKFFRHNSRCITCRNLFPRWCKIADKLNNIWCARLDRKSDD